MVFYQRRINLTQFPCLSRVAENSRTQNVLNTFCPVVSIECTSLLDKAVSERKKLT